jgi:hypothetical protein
VGYGVNRSPKKKAATWRRSSERAPAAGKRSARGSTAKKKRTGKRAASARRVKKRRSAPARAPKVKRRAARPKAARKKKSRLYTRYNPLDGTKAKVTADDPRYAAWLSRKPGKKKIRQERAAELLGGSRVGGVVLEEVARKAATSAGRIGSRVATGTVRGAAGKLAAPAVAALAGIGATQAAVLAGAGAVSYLLTRWVSDSLGKNLEDREQAALSAYVAARNKLVRDLGARDWSGVPASQRAALFAAYQAVLKKIRAPRVLEK